jgi:hypothetical protein
VETLSTCDATRGDKTYCGNYRRVQQEQEENQNKRSEHGPQLPTCDIFYFCGGFIGWSSLFAYLVLQVATFQIFLNISSMLLFCIFSISAAPEELHSDSRDCVRVVQRSSVSGWPGFQSATIKMMNNHEMFPLQEKWAEVGRPKAILKLRESHGVLSRRY